jgi:hypothetical protein
MIKAVEFKNCGALALTAGQCCFPPKPVASLSAACLYAMSNSFLPLQEDEVC